MERQRRAWTAEKDGERARQICYTTYNLQISTKHLMVIWSFNKIQLSFLRVWSFFVVLTMSQFSGSHPLFPGPFDSIFHKLHNPTTTHSFSAHIFHVMLQTHSWHIFIPLVICTFTPTWSTLSFSHSSNSALPPQHLCPFRVFIVFAYYPQHLRLSTMSSTEYDDLLPLVTHGPSQLFLLWFTTISLAPTLTRLTWFSGFPWESKLMPWEREWFIFFLRLPNISAHPYKRDFSLASLSVLAQVGQAGSVWCADWPAHLRQLVDHVIGGIFA